MSNFIYNSYCMVHARAPLTTLTTPYCPAAGSEAPAPAQSSVQPHLSFAVASLAVLGLLAAASATGDRAMLMVGALLWMMALVGWALSIPAVRRGLVTLRLGVRAWHRSRRKEAEDAHTWNTALQDARMMADLSRAMSERAQSR